MHQLWGLGLTVVQHLPSVHVVPPERRKDPDLTQKLPAAELEDYLEPQHCCRPGQARVPSPGEEPRCLRPTPTERVLGEWLCCMFLLETGGSPICRIGAESQCP